MKNLRGIDLNLLPVFAALMQHRHLSQAAQHLAMSQPAVSSALKRLRLSFNDELFIRSAKGLNPSSRAEEIFQLIQPALQMIQQGYDPQEFNSQTSQQTLAISLNPAIEYLLAPLLANFMQRFAPNMQLQLIGEQNQDHQSLLKSAQLDFSVDYLSFNDPSFEHQVLAREDLCVIAKTEHPKLKHSINAKQFAKLKHVSIVPKLKQGKNAKVLHGTPIEQLMGTHLPKRQIALYVASFVSIPAIVANSELIAVVPTRLAKQQQSLGLDLQCLALPFRYPKVDIHLIWHQSRQNDAAHQWFRQQASYLVELLSNTEGEFAADFFAKEN